MEPEPSVSVSRSRNPDDTTAPKRKEELCMYLNEGRRLADRGQDGARGGVRGDGGMDNIGAETVLALRPGACDLAVGFGVHVVFARVLQATLEVH